MFDLESSRSQCRLEARLLVRQTASGHDWISFSEL